MFFAVTALKKDQSITTLALLILVLSSWGLMDLHKRPNAAAIDSVCDSLVAKSEDAGLWAESLHHSWIDVSEASYPLEPPTPERVEEWKRFFSLIEDQESQSDHFIKTSFKTSEQYLAVQDLMEVWLSQAPEFREDITLWRLLQMDTTATHLSVSGKVFHIRDQIDSLLDFEARINVDMSDRAFLREQLYGFYDDLVLKCILQTVPSNVGVELKKEQEAWLAYFNSAKKTLETINDPSGLEFPQGLYAFCVENHILRRLSQEDILLFLYPEDEAISIDRRVMSTISDLKIAVEYQDIITTTKEHLAALEREQEDWFAWMTTRKKVSSLLSADFGEVYDYATHLVRVEKMRQMKEQNSLFLK